MVILKMRRFSDEIAHVNDIVGIGSKQLSLFPFRARLEDKGGCLSVFGSESPYHCNCLPRSAPNTCELFACACGSTLGDREQSYCWANLNLTPSQRRKSPFGPAPRLLSGFGTRHSLAAQPQPCLFPIELAGFIAAFLGKAITDKRSIDRSVH
ncbi:hypothetical protein NZK35_05610 [Stieleria sp. ICT_E10.1]|uniref:hypothetical protein n=1 Tax=Stieleria sedimenti TaxID=2976331 RepID=UPI00217FB21E|nr:hypothetical protein [Stieleria sedimenti]MCS7466150.1 hypothetical protein [Stieleria sedimenti]